MSNTMKFVVNSTYLNAKLLAIKQTISAKNTLPILDNFLFDVKDSKLSITASDLETTSKVVIELENYENNGNIAIEAARLTNLLKNLPEQPITFDIDLEDLSIDILTDNGKFSVVGQEGENFPVIPDVNSNNEFTIPSQSVFTGIAKTLFATADDELRPVMNGVLFDFKEDNLIFVATDAHKLIKLHRLDVKYINECNFILPKKPANLLRNLLKSDNNEIQLTFDDKNAKFVFDNFEIVCRLTEGVYPNYESVIPINNPNKAVISKDMILNTLKRVSTFSNQSSNLIRLKFTNDILTVAAQDIDFSISAYERLNCQYEGEEMEIGVKSTFIIELIGNLDCSEVVFEMSTPDRAIVVTPYERNDYDTQINQLVMPMMINV